MTAPAPKPCITEPEPPDRRGPHIVLIVDDAPENLAVLHDALEESGYAVMVADNGAAALARASETVPDIILLDASMPGMDGFEVCRRLRAQPATSGVPIIFMTALNGSEDIVAAFDAGATDYVAKPVRQSELLARVGAHLQSARLMNQARSALDAFGNAVLAITPNDGRIVWQTPLARQWMRRYFPAPDLVDAAEPPPLVAGWLLATSQAHRAGLQPQQLTVIQGSTRLIFTAPDVSSSEQWMIVLREESDTARVQALAALLTLTQHEAEVLHWVIKGKNDRDIGGILGISPLDVNHHLGHLFVKLGVTTRSAAAMLAVARLRAAAAGG